MDQRVSCENGSPYVVESWRGLPPGEAPLQKQIRGLFDLLHWDFDKVLSGQLVPFRSPSWDALPNRRLSLEFGVSLWQEILAEVAPNIIVAVGKTQLRHPIGKILGNAIQSDDLPIGWGTYTAGIDRFANCTLISLPHLSRFSIVGRSESASALQRIADVAAKATSQA